LAITPVGHVPAVAANVAAFEWRIDPADSATWETRLPVIVSGERITYRIHLGTRAPWLASRAVERVWLRLPRYPLRVRLGDQPNPAVATGRAPQPGSFRQ
jgi:hypothetical protein